jgi:hypothetical protein
VGANLYLYTPQIGINRYLSSIDNIINDSANIHNCTQTYSLVDIKHLGINNINNINGDLKDFLLEFNDNPIFNTIVRILNKNVENYEKQKDIELTLSYF